ncbi:MAG: amino acid synthesis family protein [Herbaspirillum sp.]
MNSNNTLTIRRRVLVHDELCADGQFAATKRLHVVAAAAVIANPFAGIKKDDLSLLSNDWGPVLVSELADRARLELGEPAVAFGKASVVGYQGTIGHGSAIIHTRTFGDAIRAVSIGSAPIASVEKLGGPGDSVDVGLRGATDTGAMDGTDTRFMFNWPLRIPGSPLPDEILIIVALADGGRLR